MSKYDIIPWTSYVIDAREMDCCRNSRDQGLGLRQTHSPPEESSLNPMSDTGRKYGSKLAYAWLKDGLVCDKR